MISAEQLADRLDLSRYPRSWRGRCPACDYPGNTFSLRKGKENFLKFFCSNCNDRDGIEDAVKRVAGDDWRATPKPSDEDAAAARQRKQELALKLWRGSVPAAGTIVARYLSARGIGSVATSPALRFRADCRHPEGGCLPGMVALVQDMTGADVAVHRTYLRRDGVGKADVEPPKASLGPIWGGAVRIDVVTDTVVIAEGIETAASAGLLMDLPAWAALSAGNLAVGLQLPPDIRNVIIAVDRDPAGEQAARKAALRWSRDGRSVRLARPDAANDFNDIIREAAHG